MEMPMPDNTLPMMTGFGQFGPLEMGGMFSVVKVREGLERNDYKDPGWYKHPTGTVAYEIDEPFRNAPQRKLTPASPTKTEIEMKVIKPTKNSHNATLKRNEQAMSRSPFITVVATAFALGTVAAFAAAGPPVTATQTLAPASLAIPRSRRESCRSRCAKAMER